MTGRGPDGRGPDTSRRPRRRPSPNENGLQALGDLIEGPRETPAVAPRETPAAPNGAGESAPNGQVAAASPSPHPKPKGGRGAEQVANHEGLSGLAKEMEHQRSTKGQGGKHSRRRRRARRGILIGLAVLLIVVGGGAGYGYYITHDLNRVEVRGLNGALTTGQEAGTENILMVGSTSRCALAQQNLAYGLCSDGVNGVNSDVIMILHADPNHHRLALLSVPRDLFIPNARSTGANKVDAGLFEGLTQLVAAIEEDFGIPIQHAVSLNFDQFANIVNALGGINMSFPMSVFDASSGLNVQAATCVHLDGTQALQVVRARHLQYSRAARRPWTRSTGRRRPRATWLVSGVITNSSGYWPPRWPSRGSGTRSPTSA
jgi:LCP family protein required for cell wall assembly